MGKITTKFNIGDTVYVAGIDHVKELKVHDVLVNSDDISYGGTESRSVWSVWAGLLSSDVIRHAEGLCFKKKKDAEIKHRQLAAADKHKRELEQYEDDLVLVVELKKRLIEVEARLARS